jgi:hypothetical protein
MKIHTRAWEKPPPALLIEQLSARCVGYCGADLKAGAYTPPLLGST